MSDFDELYKVDKTPTIGNRTIEILRTYIEKEKELNREFDEKDGIDVAAPDYEPDADATQIRLKHLLGYREIRTLQAYASKLARGDNSRDTRSRLNSMDEDRRRRHNLALTSFKGLIEFGRENGLEPLYEGPVLTDAEIDSHAPMTLDTRKEMTDAFLKILVDIDKTPYMSINNAELSGIKNDIEKVDREYKVSKPLEHDDDDINFEDFTDKYRGYGEIY